MRIANKLNPNKTSSAKTKSSLWMKLLIAIIIILVLLYFGLKIMIMILSFLSNYFIQDSGPVQTTQQEIKPEILIGSIDIPKATNSAKIKARLDIQNAKAIEIYLNDNKNDEVEIKAGDNITEFDINGLKEGDNSIFFIAKSESTEKKTKTFNIVYDKTAPEISLEEIPTTTVLDFIVIKGKVSEKSELTINGQPIVLLSDLSFEHRFFLNDGENNITIKAVDFAGNATEQELKVTKEQP
ncbi:MAG: hypothetical protein KatS3mg090_0800 [Patescibacteria group bacterium]|nr:MAG: hypothetical protein KatS3mg090_0800 [Patescibacteria group bacterium]